MSKIPQKILDQHIAIVGKTGSGKTSTEKVIVETVVDDGFRVCVLDTIKSDWWGITSSASGKSPGLHFKIMGGPKGHVPLHSSAGKVMGELVGSGKLPLSIIDMADFEAGGVQRFFIDFATSLMKNMKGVLYLVIEEAHEIAPKKKAGIGNENLAMHWAKKLATAGRSKGIRLIVATQRTQALHNAVLGSCETVIAHRLSAPADQEPIMKWLKANTDKETEIKVMKSISSLPTGTGWICSGEAKIFEMFKFPKFRTYDNTATPTKDGKNIAIKMAPVDHEELRILIGDAVKEEEANDSSILRKRIRELEAEAKKKTAPSNKELQAAHADGQKQGYGLGYEEGFLECRALCHENNKSLTDKIISLAPKDTARRRAPAPAQRVPTASPDAPSAARPSRPPSSHAGLSGPENKVLSAIAFWKGRGCAQPSRAQVAGDGGGGVIFLENPWDNNTPSAPLPHPDMIFANGVSTPAAKIAKKALALLNQSEALEKPRPLRELIAEGHEQMWLWLEGIKSWNLCYRVDTVALGEFLDCPAFPILRPEQTP